MVTDEGGLVPSVSMQDPDTGVEVGPIYCLVTDERRRTSRKNGRFCWQIDFCLLGSQESVAALEKTLGRIEETCKRG